MPMAASRLQAASIAEGCAAGAAADVGVAAPPALMLPPAAEAAALPAAALLPRRMCSRLSTGARHTGHRCVCLRSSCAHSCDHQETPKLAATATARCLVAQGVQIWLGSTARCVIQLDTPSGHPFCGGSDLWALGWPWLLPGTARGWGWRGHQDGKGRGESKGYAMWHMHVWRQGESAA